MESREIPSQLSRQTLETVVAIMVFFYLFFLWRNDDGSVWLSFCLFCFFNLQTFKITKVNVCLFFILSFLLWNEITWKWQIVIEKYEYLYLDMIKYTFFIFYSPIQNKRNDTNRERWLAAKGTDFGVLSLLVIVSPSSENSCKSPSLSFIYKMKSSEKIISEILPQNAFIQTRKLTVEGKRKPILVHSDD